MLLCIGIPDHILLMFFEFCVRIINHIYNTDLSWARLSQKSEKNHHIATLSLHHLVVCIQMPGASSINSLCFHMHWTQTQWLSLLWNNRTHIQFTHSHGHLHTQNKVLYMQFEELVLTHFHPISNILYNTAFCTKVCIHITTKQCQQGEYDTRHMYCYDSCSLSSENLMCMVACTGEGAFSVLVWPRCWRARLMI